MFFRCRMAESARPSWAHGYYGSFGVPGERRLEFGDTRSLCLA